MAYNDFYSGGFIPTIPNQYPQQQYPNPQAQMMYPQMGMNPQAQMMYPNQQMNTQMSVANLKLMGLTNQQIAALKAIQNYQAPYGYSSMNALQLQVAQMQAMGIANPYGLTVNAHGELKIPPPSIPVITQFIYQNLLSAQLVDVPFELMEFVRLDTSFISQSPIRHACKFRLLSLATLTVIQLQYFDKATIELTYCPNCYKVIYFLEKFN